MKSNCSNEMQYQENKIKNTVLVLFSPVSYFRELKDGDIELGVHIADVTHFVKPNSWTDLEARARFVQIYVYKFSYSIYVSKLLCFLLYKLSSRWYFNPVFEFEYRLEYSLYSKKSYNNIVFNSVCQIGNNCNVQYTP